MCTINADLETGNTSMTVPSAGFVVDEHVPVGCDIHAVKSWPENGLLGTQFGPNNNGPK